MGASDGVSVDCGVDGGGGSEEIQQASTRGSKQLPR